MPLTQYDSPDNNAIREHRVTTANPATSGRIVHFCTRLKSKVRAVNVVLASVASADEQFYVTRNSTTIATLTPATGGSVGSLPTSLPSSYTITLNSLNTLATLSDVISFGHVSSGGCFHVTFEYQVLPGNTEVGA